MVATGTEEVTVPEVSCGTPSIITVLFTTTRVGVLEVTVVNTSSLSGVLVVFVVVGGVVTMVGFSDSVSLVLEGVGLVFVGGVLVETEVMVGVDIDDSDVLVGVVIFVVDGDVVVWVGSFVVATVLSELSDLSKSSTMPCLRAISFSRRSGLSKLACVMANRIANTASNRKLSRENMMVEDAGLNPGFVGEERKRGREGERCVVWFKTRGVAWVVCCC